MKAINTKTQEEFNRVLKIFEKKGWGWNGGDNPMRHKNDWKVHKGNTCIDYKNNCYYCNVSYFKGNGRTIISFEQFLKEEGTEEWKEGMEVYISDYSEEDALIKKKKRILSRKCSNGIMVVASTSNEDYENGKVFHIVDFKYAVPVPKETELTMQEIADKFEIDVENLKIKK